MYLVTPQGLGAVNEAELLDLYDGTYQEYSTGRIVFRDPITNEWTYDTTATPKVTTVKTPPVASTNPLTPGSGPTAPGASVPVRPNQTPNQRTAVSWAESRNLLPSLQQGTGLSNLHMVLIGGGLLLVLMAGSGGAGYRYGRR
jgi:hypothetical protein